MIQVFLQGFFHKFAGLVWFAELVHRKAFFRISLNDRTRAKSINQKMKHTAKGYNFLDFWTDIFGQPPENICIQFVFCNFLTRKGQEQGYIYDLNAISFFVNTLFWASGDNLGLKHLANSCK